MTRKDQERLQALEAFLDEHEGMITTALTVYAERMRADAKPALARYAEIKDDPEQRAAQDQTWITTEGLRMAGEMFNDSAHRADRTRMALDKIMEEGEDQ